MSKQNIQAGYIKEIEAIKVIFLFHITIPFMYK